MVKSENGVLLTKEEFEKLEEKWKKQAGIIIKLTSVMTEEGSMGKDTKKLMKDLNPILEQLQSNAVELAFTMVRDELFD